MLQKIKNFFSKPRPGILSFAITKDGTINPSLSRAAQDAEPQSFWERTGLANKSPIGIPYWEVLAFPILIWFLWVGAGFIGFLIQLGSNLLIPFLATHLSENSLSILATSYTAQALIFLFDTGFKFLAVIAFGWMLSKIWKSIKK